MTTPPDTTRRTTASPRPRNPRELVPAEEAREILGMVGGDLSRGVVILQGQLDVLHSRAQVLTTLAGLVVTVTGFSGRLIASTNLPAQILVISGLAVVLSSAVYVIWTVMRLQWVTSVLSRDKEATVETLLLRRNRKTRCLVRGGAILFLGLFLYFLAIALMLTNPTPMGRISDKCKNQFHRN